MRLLLSALLRKPLRTLLTVVSIALALFLYCFLESVLYAFNVGVSMSSASRLVVQHKESLAFQIPISYRSSIRQCEGVSAAVPMVWFGGLYKPKDATGEVREEFFAQFAVEMQEYLSIVPEVVVRDREQLRALLADQAGCVVGDKTAERLNIRVGDRIVLRSQIWNQPGNKPWAFNVRAIYTSDSPSFDRTMMLFHYKYFDEGREFGKGMIGIFLMSIQNPDRFQEIATAIDRRFENSPFETKTVTEKAFNMQFVQMMGNLQLLLRSIGSAIVLTMLLVAANTMMMSARDKTREMGILKSIGFTDAYVFRLLIGESLVVAALGYALGAGLAYGLFNLAEVNPKPDFFPIFTMPREALLGALGIAALTGVLSGIVPALAGMRLKATEALRSV
ncbi:MAG: FtsX-like permease family protein [Planctomycetota bacterium]|nr:FtsX-like permease family protein [Planctomycetota bacterium]